jgi:hypothetical protein
MKCKNTDTINDGLEKVAGSTPWLDGDALFKITKRQVVEDIKAIFELIAEDHALSAIKNTKGGKYDSLIRESLSSKITEIAETILECESLK